MQALWARVSAKEPTPQGGHWRSRMLNIEGWEHFTNQNTIDHARSTPSKRARTPHQHWPPSHRKPQQSAWHSGIPARSRARPTPSRSTRMLLGELCPSRNAHPTTDGRPPCRVRARRRGANPLLGPFRRAEPNGDGLSERLSKRAVRESVRKCRARYVRVVIYFFLLTIVKNVLFLLFFVQFRHLIG